MAGQAGGPLSLWLKQISAKPAKTPLLSFCDAWLANIIAASSLAWCAGVFSLAWPWLVAAFAATLLLRLYAKKRQVEETRKFSVLHILGESSPQVELIRVMTEWFKSSAGAERIAPQLMPLLDGLADARERAARLLKDHKDSQDAPFKRNDILITLDLALADAIWMGRHLIRLPRQRKTTFASRIAEPGFQAAALASIAETLEEAKALVDSISQASGRDSALYLRRHLARLEEIHAAREELGPEPEFLENLMKKE